MRRGSRTPESLLGNLEKVGGKGRGGIDNPPMAVDEVPVLREDGPADEDVTEDCTDAAEGRRSSGESARA